MPYGDNCMREKNIRADEDRQIQFVTEDELLDILGIDCNLYEEVKTWSLGRIRSYGMPKPKKQLAAQSPKEENNKANKDSKDSKANKDNKDNKNNKDNKENKD